MTIKRILVIAPHPDDESLGAGGAIAKFVSEGHEVKVLTVSGHLPPLYELDDFEKIINEAKEAYKILGVSSFSFLDIPATMVRDIPIHEMNSKISNVVNDFQPNIVLSPYPDRHIDHRLVFDSVMVATRPVGVGRGIEILASYETLSETHWNAPHIEPNFTPNWVIDITDQIGIKLQAIGCYKSQISDFPNPRSTQAVEALAKFRGTQAGFSFGEGLHIIRKIS